MMRELKPTRFGRQPAKRLIGYELLAVTDLAREIGVKFTHLRNALDGRVAPSPVLIERLSARLDKPAEELFTQEARDAYQRRHLSV